jgi:hypothetical protein
LLSVAAYLVGVSEQVDFLEQGDTVGTIFQVAVPVGSLLVARSSRPDQRGP